MGPQFSVIQVIRPLLYPPPLSPGCVSSVWVPKDQKEQIQGPISDSRRGLALDSWPVISWATAQRSTGLVTPCEVGALPKYQAFGAHPLDLSLASLCHFTNDTWCTSAPLQDGADICPATCRTYMVREVLILELESWT